MNNSSLFFLLPVAAGAVRFSANFTHSIIPLCGPRVSVAKRNSYSDKADNQAGAEGTPEGTDIEAV